MQDVKKSVAQHVSKSKADYDKILERFEILTHKLDAEGRELGYRTLIVHQGERLETIMPEHQNQRELFLELQRYIGKIINDLLKMSDDNWDRVVEFRRKRRAELLGR